LIAKDLKITTVEPTRKKATKEEAHAEEATVAKETVDEILIALDKSIEELIVMPLLWIPKHN